jgi:hypothetical protein
VGKHARKLAAIAALLTTPWLAACGGGGGETVGECRLHADNVHVSSGAGVLTAKVRNDCTVIPDSAPVMHAIIEKRTSTGGWIGVATVQIGSAGQVVPLAGYVWAQKSTWSTNTCVNGTYRAETTTNQGGHDISGTSSITTC